MHVWIALPVLNRVLFGVDIINRRLEFIYFQGKSDPFITIKYGSGKEKEKFRTKVIYNTLNPVWNETCRLPLPNEDDKMIVVSSMSFF